MNDRRSSCPTPLRRSYGTRTEALKKRPSSSRNGRSIAFPYQCTCGAWHLGTQREPQGPRRTCPTPDKVGFATQDSAQRRAVNISVMRGVEISTYECKCGWWHLTSH